MRIKMLILACGAAIISVFFYFLDAPDWRVTIVMVAVPTAYHLAVRLAVGWFVFHVISWKINYKNAWFKQKRLEPKFYNLIRVHGWKNMFPSYAPELFNIDRGIEKVIISTCKAEIAHFILIFISFIPMCVALIVGCNAFEIMVFAVTGLIASLVDLLFLFVMRYNRPRLISVYENRLKQKNESV